MITYELFEEKIYREFKEYLGDKAEIKFQDICKDNGVIKRGMVIKPIDRTLAPTIYLQDYYREYIEGDALSNIFYRITSLYEKARMDQDVDIKYILDFEKVRECIFVRLINFERNKCELENKPYRRWLDLAITYYIEIANPVIGNGIIKINNDILKTWDIDEETLNACAMENVKTKQLPRFTSMKEFLLDRFGANSIQEYFFTDSMYILTNKEMKYGSNVLLNPDFIENIADKLKSDIFIIPSSIHELIAIKKELVVSCTSALETIAYVNNEEVPPEDILSYNMYYYCRESKEIVLINGAS